MNSRRTAAFIVARWLTTHEFPSEMLPQEGADRAFVQDLVYTVVRRFRPLRVVLGALMKTWPKGELEALVLVGAAQILYMPDVPDFAAVHETVAAAKTGGTGRRLDRVVNGVLRNLIRRRAELEAKLAAAPLAERASFPNALVRRWIARYGAERAEALAAWHNTPAETWLAYPPQTAEDGKVGSFVKLARGRKVTEVEGYAEGAFLVQDPATALAVDLLEYKTALSIEIYMTDPGSVKKFLRYGSVKSPVHHMDRDLSALHAPGIFRRNYRYVVQIIFLILFCHESSSCKISPVTVQ